MAKIVSNICLQTLNDDLSRDGLGFRKKISIADLGILTLKRRLFFIFLGINKNLKKNHLNRNFN